MADSRKNTDEHNHPHYDVVDDIDDDMEVVHELEVRSDRGSTIESMPRITPRKAEIHYDDEEAVENVTRIEISSVRGSVVAPKVKEAAPSIPLPEHPSYHQSPPPPPPSQPQSTPPKTANPEMAFDIGAENIQPIMEYKMDMNDRDPNKNVQFLNTNFFEIFIEPSEQYHSIACVWTLSFKIFEIIRIYSYKILTLIFGLIIAVIGGFLFALVAFLNIWIIRPTLVLARIGIAQILYVWPVFLVYVVRPFFYSVGAIFSTARLHTSKGEQIGEVWEKHVHTV